MIGLDTSILVAHAIEEHPQHEASQRWLKWLVDFQLGRNRLLDTLIAVNWHAAGVREICTLNPRDFKVFDVFRIHCIGAD